MQAQTLGRQRSMRVRAAAVILAMVASVLAVVVGAKPAWADTTHCSGNSYSTCINAGYTDHGYSAHSATSYWGAYTGHNCTNYAAYMQKVINGATTSTHGNASQWDNNAPAGTVDTTPGLGSVAQWEANSAPGVGSAGHVAYVEAVHANGSITISEDNWSSGPFSWRTISAGSANWPDHFIHFKDLMPTASAQRVGNLNSSNELWVKEGALNATWTLVATDVDRFQLSGNRIAVLQGTTLSVKEGSIGASWVTVTTGADDFRLAGNRLGVLSNGALLVKEGSLGAMWVTLASSGVASFDLSPNRVGMLEPDGDAWVKEGPLGATWTLVSQNVSKIRVIDTRIGVLNGTNLSIKEGSVGATWVLVINPTVDFQLSGNRIMARQTDGALLVKEGALGATWTTITNNQDGFAVTGTRIAVWAGGTLNIKEGSVGATWTTVATGGVVAGGLS